MKRSESSENFLYLANVSSIKIELSDLSFSSLISLVLFYELSTFVKLLISIYVDFRKFRGNYLNTVPWSEDLFDELSKFRFSCT